MLLNRPYCTKELQDIEQSIHNRYRLGDLVVTHLPCNHSYRVKRGGRKEEHVLDCGSTLLDSQTCSVCFKMRRTSVYPNIENICEYEKENNVWNISPDIVQQKIFFYKWLYIHHP